MTAQELAAAVDALAADHKVGKLLLDAYIVRLRERNGIQPTGGETWNEMKCPHCHKPMCWSNGDVTDLTLPDVDVVRCWSCTKPVDLTSLREYEMGYADRPTAAELEERAVTTIPDPRQLFADRACLASALREMIGAEASRERPDAYVISIAVDALEEVFPTPPPSPT